MFHVPEAARVLDGPMATATHVGHYGAFDLASPEPGWRLAIICDDGTNGDVPESLGWEHVSVHAYRSKQSRIPTWKEMAFVKAQCWDDEDVVVQYHPRKSEYVNAHPNVLHLWCLRGHAMPTPPASLVGPIDTVAPPAAPAPHDVPRDTPPDEELARLLRPPTTP